MHSECYHRDVEGWSLQVPLRIRIVILGTIHIVRYCYSENGWPNIILESGTSYCILLIVHELMMLNVVCTCLKDEDSTMIGLSLHLILQILRFMTHQGSFVDCQQHIRRCFVE